MVKRLICLVMLSAGPVAATDHLEVASDETTEETPVTTDPADETEAPLTVRHVAPASAEPDAELRLEVVVAGSVEVTAWIDGVKKAVTGEGDSYVLVIPAAQVKPPDVRYALEVRRGEARWTFAAPEAPHRVQVADGGADPHGRDLDRASDARAIAVHASFAYGSFGPGGVSVLEPSGLARRVSIDDFLWQVEGGASYRFHGLVHELGLGLRVARGRSPSRTIAVADALDPAAFDVGLEAGVANLALRLAPGLYGGPWTLLGHSDRGFACGAGGTLRLGEAYGDHFEIRGGFIREWGAEASARGLLLPVEWLGFGATAELTGAPRGETLGVGFTGDLAVFPGAGFALSARGGYQTRLGLSGGPVVGGGVRGAF